MATTINKTNIPQQQKITEFFNTTSVSASKQQKNLKSKSSVNEKLSQTIDHETVSKRTPKRRQSNASSLSTATTASSKKRKTMVKSEAVAKTDTKLVRRGKHANIDYGPMEAIRKLNFDDCIEQNKTDDNNNDKVISFEDFLKSKTGTDLSDKSESQKKLNDAPLMNADDIKERLRSCKDISKLKEQLSKINDCAEKVRQFKEMKIKYQPSPSNSPIKSSSRNALLKNLSPLRLSCSPIKIANSSPLKSSPIKPRNLFGTISLPKTPSKKNKDDSNDLELPLPIRFKRMAEIFRLIDLNSWRLFKRQEVCTFDKIKQFVEDATHRTFTLDMLIKILTVDKDHPRFKLTWEPYSGQLKLVITPIYEKQIQCLNSVGQLLERSNQFHRCLLEITRMEHLKFLSQMKLSLGDNEQIYRWHPMFQLDSVPDIKPDFTILPNKPSVTQQIPSANNSKKNTILNYFSSRKSLETSNNQNESSKLEDNKTEDFKIKSGALKGISSDLLNKVRAKEAAKLAQLMKRPPEKDREIRTLAKLIDVSRIIYESFIGSGIKTIEKEDLVQKISDSLPMSVNESRRHLEYLFTFELDQVGTKWINVIPLKQSHYIQIDSTFPLANLYAAIRRKMKLLQES